MSKRFRWAIGLLVLVLAFAFVRSFGPFQAGQKGRRLPTGTGTPAVAIGDNHGVILASDGSLWTWGGDAFGWRVLGLGSSVRTQACLRRIGSETNWVNIAVCASTTLALRADGTIWAWGENLHGQLGDGTMARDQPYPVRSVPGNDWKQVASGGTHSVALKQDGTLWSWGNNWAGQLGDGSTNSSRLPVRIGSSTNWVRIWANLIQNVGQQRDGSLWFWGWDYSRSRKGSSISTPTRVSPDTNWVSVGMGSWMAFAIKSDGTLWTWGRQAHLYTGSTNAATDSWPVRVGWDRDWLSCASFSGSSPIFLKRDASLWKMEAPEERGVAAVTATVVGLVTNNQLRIVADNTTLGGDPAYGIVKSLQIQFQLGATNRVLNFMENSPVAIVGNGESLVITRALYGDPKLLRAVGVGAFQAQPARLRRIEVPSDIVAFCEGRHGLGVALTSRGDAWTWGEALGQQRPGIPPLAFCSMLLNRIGLAVDWGSPRPIIHENPARFGIFNADGNKP